MATTTMTTMRMAPARRSPAGVVQRRNPTKAMLVRPYTVRKGDTVFKISQKRGKCAATATARGIAPPPSPPRPEEISSPPAPALTSSPRFSLSLSLSLGPDVKIEDILSVNHGLRKDTILEGQTILLPSSKLSERDREILDGVGKGKGKYRAYPVRKGEVIEDIIEKRGIKMEEVEALNEGVVLSSLKGEPHPATRRRRADPPTARTDTLSISPSQLPPARAC